MAEEGLMTVIYVTGVVVVCIHVTAVLRRVLHTATSRSTFRDAVQVCKLTLCSFWRRSREERRDHDTLGLIVQKRLEGEAVVSMRSGAAYSAHAYALITAGILVQIYQGSAHWITPVQFVAVAIAAALNSFLHFFPALISPRTLHVVYASQMLFTMLFNAFWSTTELGAFVTVIVVCVLRPAHSLAFCHNLAVPLVNILAFGASVVEKSVCHDACPWSILMFEAGACIYVIALARYMQESRAATVCQEEAATTLSGENTGRTSLLDLVYDVVVELDHDLQLTEDSPRLSAFLALGGRAKNLAGSKLQDFMPAEEDRQRFEQRLLGKVGSEDFGEGQAEFLPGVVPALMRGSLGSNALGVELFYARYKCLGQWRFFVGLREQAEEPEVRFARRRRRSRRSQGAAEAEASTASVTEESFGGPGRSDFEDPSADSSSEASVCETSSLGRLMEPKWKQIPDKGKKLVLLRAMERCNIFVEPTWCCMWHASVSDMQKTLDEFESFSCAEAFSVRGDRQCAKCRALESTQEGGNEGIVPEAVAEGACGICSYYGNFARRAAARVAL